MNRLYYVSQTGETLTRQHNNDAGLDLATPHALTINPGEMTPVDTGIAVAIPNGYVGLVFVRSSIGIKRRCTLANGTGVIDAGYRGTITVALVNNGIHTVEFDAGERIAQLVLVPCSTPVPVRVETVEPTTWQLIDRKRAQRGMSITDLVEKAGLEPETVDNWHENEPTLATLRKLAKALDVNVWELIGGETPRSTGGIGSTGKKTVNRLKQ